jgi:endonuclease/exonuclease/phosphatase family metal-dependent hydrolase
VLEIPEHQFCLMSFNILYGGTHLGQSLEQTAAVIRLAQADIVVACEQWGNAEPLADLLGFTCHIVVAPPYWKSVAVLSRYPITETFANGVRLELDLQQSVCVFGVHLTSTPYQPYRVRDKAYTKKEEILDEARETREQELVVVLSEIRPLIEAGERVLLCGDFNEPSHLDWTLASAREGHHFGLEMPWPCSKRVTESGMEDAYRVVFPDVCRHPGYTWTSVPGLGVGGSERAEDEVHDRIDFIYYAGLGLEPRAASIVGENSRNADLVVSPFPSDHRAVAVIYQIS